MIGATACCLRQRRRRPDAHHVQWAQMDLNHRPHPYQMCDLIWTVRIMNDQISTVGAGQDVFTKGQRGPGEVMVEQRVAGRFFDFSLTHPARSETAVVQQRERPRRSVTAKERAPRPGQPRSLAKQDPERRGGGLTRASEEPLLDLDPDCSAPVVVSARDYC